MDLCAFIENCFSGSQWLFEEFPITIVGYKVLRADEINPKYKNYRCRYR